MKTILTIISTIIITSCSNDSNKSTENCDCNTIIESNVYNVPGHTFTEAVLENDCSGVQKSKTLEGSYEVGVKICN